MPVGLQVLTCDDFFSGWEELFVEDYYGSQVSFCYYWQALNCDSLFSMLLLACCYPLFLDFSNHRHYFHHQPRQFRQNYCCWGSAHIFWCQPLVCPVPEQSPVNLLSKILINCMQLPPPSLCISEGCRLWGLLWCPAPCVSAPCWSNHAQDAKWVVLAIFDHEFPLLGIGSLWALMHPAKSKHCE